MSALLRWQSQLIDAITAPEAPSPLPAGLSQPGLDAYRGNARLVRVEALLAAFPVCGQLVGAEFMRGVCRRYVSAEPAASANLCDDGARMGDFLAQFAPAAELPYLADVARLEMLRIRAFHAADADPLTPEQITQALADPTRLPLLQVGCHPSLNVLNSRYAIVSLWAAHQGIGDLASVNPALPEIALVIRVGLEVQVIALPPGGDVLIAGFAAGLPLGEAAGLAIATHPDFDLTAHLALLLRCGALSSFSLPTEVPS